MFTGAFPFCWKDDEPDLQVHCPITFHARIQKVLSEGVQLWQVFLWGEGGSKCPYKQAIIGPPARRILNADDGPTLNAGLVALGFLFDKDQYC